MEIITTHNNADFDAVGSMLAAKRLYPEARLVFPGGQEKSLRDFFVRSTVNNLQVERTRDIPLEEITKLILVDCRQRSRIGPLAKVADKKEVEVIIYDHHPPSENDIAGDLEFIEPAGSTLAILCRQLAAKKISLQPDEATIMAMGIYEDTGSLTFSSTTVADYQAAAYLLEQGADLSLVAELMNRTLSSQQIFLLGDLIRNIRRRQIHGIDVVTTEAGAGEHNEDLAVLIHRLVEMENLPNVFALLHTDDRIALIARSRVEELDAGAVARVFGGGGHATAASASIKELTPAQAKETLLETLYATVQPSMTARQMMTYPAKSISVGQTIKAAQDLLTRHDINTLLVTDQERLVGLLSRQTVAKADHHDFADDVVQDYMSTQFQTVAPGDAFAEIYGIMVSGRQPLVPVIEDGRPVGVITRADFIRFLHAEQSKEKKEFLPTQEAAARPEMRKDVLRMLKSRLPAKALSRLRELGRVSQELGFQTYLVGGMVRDMLLDITNLDIDVVVEGDGIALARGYAKDRDCRVTAHERFGTAIISFADGFKIDVATARTEYYDQPAALPVVEASSLKLDLYRRDFTINTLVIGLNTKDFGRLVDFFGAYRDLKDETLRVLHNMSFIEDPTRILRAVRFELRFGFSIGKPTMRLLNKAVSLRVLSRLSGQRLFQELKYLLKEDNPNATIARLAELEILEQLHPDLATGKQVLTVLRNTEEVLAWWRLTDQPRSCQVWLIHLYALLAFFRPSQTVSFCDRMDIRDRLRERIIKDKADAEQALEQLSDADRRSNSSLYRLLRPLSIEALLFAMTKTYRRQTRQVIANYLTQLSRTKISLSGKDLQKLGVRPSPLYRQVLDRVLNARLDQQVRTKAEELALAREILAESGDQGQISE